MAFAVLITIPLQTRVRSLYCDSVSIGLTDCIMDAATDTFPSHIKAPLELTSVFVCVIRTGERKQTGAPRVACRLQHTGYELFRIQQR